MELLLAAGTHFFPEYCLLSEVLMFLTLLLGQRRYVNSFIKAEWRLKVHFTRQICLLSERNLWWDLNKLKFLE